MSKGIFVPSERQPERFILAGFVQGAKHNAFRWNAKSVASFILPTKYSDGIFSGSNIVTSTTA
jgi:hypothetical protein